MSSFGSLDSGRTD